MSTPLHDVEALVSIAAHPDGGPARDWATARLALVAPDRFEVFPTGEAVHDVVIAANPPRLVAAAIEALAGEVGPAVASSLGMLRRYGVQPADPDALTHAIRGAIRGDGREADLWLVYALSELGALDDGDVRAAAAAQSRDRSWLLSAVVLRHAAARGALADVAPAVAAGLLPRGDAPPDLLAAALGALGAPVSLEFDGDDLAAVAASGAAAAGGDPPEVGVKKGSRKRRVQNWVDALLDGRSTPSAALLRAAVQAGDPNQWGPWAVALAAWLHTFEAEDPLEDVLYRSAGVLQLSDARRAVAASDANVVNRALKRNGDPAIAALALELLPNAPELARVVIEELGGAPDLVMQVLCCAAAWTAADDVPTLVREARPVGLLVAEWAPTEEVLAALLEVEPANPSERTQLAFALAAMGDRAALPALEALLAEDEEGRLAPAAALVADLFT